MKLWWDEVCATKLDLMDGDAHPWGYQILLEGGPKIMGYVLDNNRGVRKQTSREFATLNDAKAWVEAMYVLQEL